MTQFIRQIHAVKQTMGGWPLNNEINVTFLGVLPSDG